MDIECGGFTFVSNFDSSNIDRVELVPKSENDLTANNDMPIYEFNIWTRADCAGTEFENNNRSWFYFGVKGGIPCTDVKLNVVNLNKQGKLYNQGMAPVYRVIPGSNRWERVHDRLSFDLKKNLLSFEYRTLENLCATTYFAFTYPFSFTDLQNSLKQFDSHARKYKTSPAEANPDDIYYHRECLVKSLEDRSVELITISSHHGITTVREPRLKGLFPDSNTSRSYQFKGKKVIFLSARVHPGETPSSYVMNGVLQLLLNKTDLTAITLRKLYVFKFIPMLNPDGVSRGFYRTDTRGANLNRFYINPNATYHPSIFAARSLILYYHYGYEKKEEPDRNPIGNKIDPKTSDVVLNTPNTDSSISKIFSNVNYKDNTSDEPTNKINILDTDDLNEKVSEITVAEGTDDKISTNVDDILIGDSRENCSVCKVVSTSLPKLSSASTNETNSRKILYKIHQFLRPKLENSKRSHESGLYLYMDFHGHAPKKGIFMYGNHFENISDKVECLLLPKLLSLNDPHFHYNQCNFSRRNMYTRDRRDGLSREGCGRVAVLKYTGLVRSYTLECNYNTGCIVNIIPPAQRSLGKHLVQPVLVPPKYTPQIYEEFGRALCFSILDMTGSNPNSRLPLSQYKSVNGLKESIRGEAIVARNVQTSQQNLKMRQGIALLQRGNKNVGVNHAAKRNLLSLKRQSKNGLFSEIPSPQTIDKKENAAVPCTSKTSRTNTANPILHPLNVCISATKIKKRKTKILNDVQKKKLMKKKILGAYKIDKNVWQNKGESSERNLNKRKIEKKLNPTGNASTSARPPKKRKKSKIM